MLAAGGGQAWTPSASHGSAPSCLQIAGALLPLRSLSSLMACTIMVLKGG